MFRVVFVPVGGGERELVVAAKSEKAAIRIAGTRAALDAVVTCTRLDSLEDWAVQDGRLRLSQRQQPLACAR